MDEEKGVEAQSDNPTQKKYIKGKDTLIMAAFRVTRNSEGIADLSIINDMSLSFRARGIWLYVFMQKDHDMKFCPIELSKPGRDRPSSIESALDELIALDYAIMLKKSKKRIKQDGLPSCTTKFYSYVFFDFKANSAEKKHYKQLFKHSF